MTCSKLPAILLPCAAILAWPVLGRAEPAAEATPASEAMVPAVTAPAAPAPAMQPPDQRPRFYFRAGGAYVKPLSSSREMELADIEGPASLAVQNGPIAGSGATISSANILAGIVGYVLPFWNRRVSTELVLGIPPTVKFHATGTLANMSIAPTALGIPTGVKPLGAELGQAVAAPVVVTATYQPLDGMVRPYVGLGAGVLVALDAKVTNPMLTAVRSPEMSIPPAPGLVLQGGLDVRLWKQVYARLDVKYIAFMTARAEVQHIAVETPDIPLFGNVEVGTAKMNIDVNPLIVQLGVGFDFDL